MLVVLLVVLLERPLPMAMSIIVLLLAVVRLQQEEAYREVIQPTKIGRLPLPQMLLLQLMPQSKKNSPLERANCRQPSWATAMHALHAVSLTRVRLWLHFTIVVAAAIPATALQLVGLVTKEVGATVVAVAAAAVAVVALEMRAFMR